MALARINFSYNYLKSIQVVVVHISEAYWKALQFCCICRWRYTKYGVSPFAYAAKLVSFCSKSTSNAFILKSKGPSMNPWGTPVSIFDHVLKRWVYFDSLFTALQAITNKVYYAIKCFRQMRLTEHHNDPLDLKILSNFLSCLRDSCEC